MFSWWSLSEVCFVRNERKFFWLCRQLKNVLIWSYTCKNCDKLCVVLLENKQNSKGYFNAFHKGLKGQFMTVYPLFHQFLFRWYLQNKPCMQSVTMYRYPSKWLEISKWALVCCFDEWRGWVWNNSQEDKNCVSTSRFIH